MGNWQTRARLRLREAGDRAYGLSAFPAARRFYNAAVVLWPADDEDLAELLFRRARAVHSFEPTLSLDLITEARDALRAAGDLAQTAEAEILAGEVFWLLGRRDEGFERVHAAQALIADQSIYLEGEGAFITGSDLLMDGGVTAAYWYGELAPK